MPLIELRNVSKAYRRGGFFSRKERVPVLEGVDLDLHAGECLGLVGRSGSGKSTLGRIMLGLEAPDSGTAKILGTDVSAGRSLSPQLRSAVQVVFQDSIGSCNPRMTAGEIIAEPLRNFEGLRGRNLREKVEHLMETVGLSPADADKLPSRFSGGQLQRVCIARALAPTPRVIVLDEAVSSLDMIIQARILDLLDKLRREHGTAYLFVTHDLRLVRRFCDRAFIVSERQLHAFSPKQAVPESLPLGPAASALAELSGAVLAPMPVRDGATGRAGAFPPAS
jgi:nickel transport system ATP-binding protein